MNESKAFKVYAQRVQNNWANETELVGVYSANTENHAVFKARNDWSNKGIYYLESYFALEVEK